MTVISVPHATRTRGLIEEFMAGFGKFMHGLLK